MLLRPLLAVCAAAGLLGLACQGNPRCSRLPVGSVTVFLENEGPSASFAATVVEIGAPSESGLRRYRLREPGGSEHVLVFRAPEESIPLALERAYEFTVETVPGAPTPAAVVVRDEEGIVYAGVSDYRPGERVLREGLAGFALEMIASDCQDRAEDPCLDSEVNAILRVEHAGSTAQLFHGDSATLGTHRIRCLTARTVTYSANCADAGVFGVSYTIERLP